MRTSCRNSAARLANDGPVSSGQHLAVSFARLHQPQLADVARKSHLGGGDAGLLQLARQFLLGVNMLGADQLQDLAMAVGSCS